MLRGSRRVLHVSSRLNHRGGSLLEPASSHGASTLPFTCPRGTAASVPSAAAAAGIRRASRSSTAASTCRPPLRCPGHASIRAHEYGHLRSRQRENRGARRRPESGLAPWRHPERRPTGLGAALLGARALVAVPSVISKLSWNVAFGPDTAAGQYALLEQDRLVLDTKLNPPTP